MYLNHLYYWNSQKSSFGLYLGTGELRGGEKGLVNKEKYCPKSKGCNIVEMCLDLNNMELKYIINNKDYGKAFDIPPGEYRVGVCLAWNNTYELLSYDTK